MVKKGGLGRGLGDLLRTNELEIIDKDRDVIENIKLDEIRPSAFQPRRTFREKDLDELAQSIKEMGVLQPIIVRKSGDNKYELVAGERRLRASSIVGLEKIPAVIRKYSDREVMQIALVENLQRADLNAIEVAVAYKNLIDSCSFTQEKLAEKLGKSRTAVANTMRLLNLHTAVQDKIAAGLLTEGQARPLLAITEASVQEKMAERIIAEGLSARAVEDVVRNLLLKSKEEEYVEEIGTLASEEDILVADGVENADVAELYVNEAKDRMQSFFGTKVFIKRGKTKGKIEIEFYSPDDLVRIVDNVLGSGNAKL